MAGAACAPGCGDDTSETTPGELTLSPSSADVATCRSQTFAATPADGVTWSLKGEGTVADGVYDAPIKVPSPASATVTATRDGETDSATVTLATAFPEELIDTGRVPFQGTPDHVHPVAAHGDRVYALLEDDDGPNEMFGGSLAIVRSDDGGLTWGAPVALPGGSRSPAVAIDAGDDDTVYVTLHGEDAAAGSTLDLAISADGAATFTTTRLFVGGNGEMIDADVVSGSPGSVTVTGPATWQDGNGGQGATLLIWHDEAKGAGFAPLAALDNGYQGQWSPGLEQRLASGHLIETGENRGGPQLATNGAGKVCLASTDYDVNETAERDFVMCSSDGGKTFGAPTTVVSDAPVNIERLRVAVSPDGATVVATYNGFTDISLDPIGKTHYAVSTNGGKSYGPDQILADAVVDGAPVGVYDAEVFIDSLGVIWFVRTLDNTSLQFDKSCDQGETLSGAFTVSASINLKQGYLFESSAGLFGIGHRNGDTDAGISVFRLLKP